MRSRRGQRDQAGQDGRKPGNGPDDDEPRRHSGPVRVRVPAKINLHLGVGPLRSDGFHELNTVYHAIGLFDEHDPRGGHETTLRVSELGEQLGISAERMRSASVSRVTSRRTKIRPRIAPPP